MSLFKISERFKSVQGEGVYAGTPMAFIRFVGCSVGKRICQHCDTDFEAMHSWRGGGVLETTELLAWADDYTHICLTGGEPLDQHPDALRSLIEMAGDDVMFHIESSGTVMPPTWLVDMLGFAKNRIWLCVSPKPGFLEDAVKLANEVKVIVPGLGTPESLRQLSKNMVKGVLSDETAKGLMHVYGDRDTFRWPEITDALRWARAGKTVFLQPRNARFDIDANNLRIVQDIVAANPSLRLSVQLHKLLKVQ